MRKMHWWATTTAFVGIAALGVARAHASPLYILEVQAGVEAPAEAPAILNAYSGQAAQKSESSSATACSADGSECASAQAFATADLATGTAGVSAATTGVGVVPGPAYFGHATGKVEEFDTIYFDISGATSSTVTNIPVTFTLHGSSTGLLFEGLLFSAAIGVQWGGVPQTGVLQEAYAAPSDASLQTFQGTETFSGDLVVLGPNPIAGFDLDLLADCDVNCTADFSDTASVSLDLPPGVTFTSASGVFLTQPFEEVAEPTALAGFAPALVGLAFLRRRKSKGLQKTLS